MQINSNILRALLISAAKKDVRYYLLGIHVFSDGKNAYAESTDGHRACRVKLPACPAIDAILDRAHVEAAVKMTTASKPADIEVAVDGDRATLTVRGAAIQRPLVDGKFPDVDRVTPRDASVRDVRVYNPKFLLDAAEQCRLLDVHHDDYYYGAVILRVPQYAAPADPTVQAHYCAQHKQSGAGALLTGDVTILIMSLRD